MFRRLVVFSVATGMCLGLYADVSACGDKFMRIGRTPSGFRYAALHPSSILIYRPADSTAKDIAEFEDWLKHAGHTPRVLQRGENVAPVLATSNYALLIAAYSDIDMLKGSLGHGSSQPAILPILNGASKAVEAQARQEFQFLLKPRGMRPNDALKEIDQVIGVRLKDTSKQTR